MHKFEGIALIQALEKVFAEESSFPSASILEVLVIGTGTGVDAVTTAKLAEFIGRDIRITAIDVNPDALRLTQDNARRNGVSTKIQVKQTYGDLQGLGRFHLIVSNMLEPSFDQDARSLIDPDLFLRIIHSLPDHLHPQGMGLMRFTIGNSFTNISLGSSNMDTRAIVADAIYEDQAQEVILKLTTNPAKKKLDAPVYHQLWKFQKKYDRESLSAQDLRVEAELIQKFVSVRPMTFAQPHWFHPLTGLDPSCGIWPPS